VAVVAVALLGVAVVGWRVAGGGACDAEERFTVAAAPEIAPVLDAAAREVTKDAVVDGVCALEVTLTAPDDAVTAIRTGEAAPDLWVPDTSAWLSRLPGPLQERQAWPLAKTPVVLAGELGRATPSSWYEALSEPGAELLDPRGSGASIGALAALHAEAVRGVITGTELSRWLAAKAQSAPDHSLDDAELLDNAADGGDAAPRWFPSTEQRLIQHLEDAGSGHISATVPTSGTVFLDYPLLATAQGERAAPAAEAAQALADSLQSGAGAQRLARAGFRPVSGVPTEAQSGVGVVEELGVVQPDTVSDLLQTWVALTADARTLVVLDVSGSMGDYVGATSRIALARDAALSALEGLSDDWQLGLWAFSQGLGDGGTDHRRLVATRALDADVDGSDQRAELEEQVRRLPGLVGGATGLYDTALAAYRSAVEGYRPGHANSVVLMTDGRNEDPAGLSQRQLLEQLTRLQDDARPVQVFTIGMGPEADVAALRRIAEATGGQSYVARDPRDVAQVFDDVLLERAGWGLR
jgi:Mg-chelatase subunit ChlD